MVTVLDLEKRVDRIEYRVDKMEEQIQLTREFNAAVGEKIECVPEIKKNMEQVKIETVKNTETLKIIKRLIWGLIGGIGTILVSVIIAVLVALI